MLFTSQTINTVLCTSFLTGLPMCFFPILSWAAISPQDFQWAITVVTRLLLLVGVFLHTLEANVGFYNY